MTAHQFEPLLRRTIAELDRPDQATRDAVYASLRQTLVRQLQASGRSEAEIDEELQSFLQAVARVESDAAGQSEYMPPPRPRPLPPRMASVPAATSPERKPFPLIPVAIAGVVVAALAAASIVYLMTPRRSTPAAPPPRAETPPPKVVAATPAPGAKEQPAPAVRPAGVPPSAVPTKAVSEDTASYWLRRQRVFYRTTHPPGTIVVSLNQRFLYVVQPNQVAIRYAVGVGPACNNASGLFRITEKVARATPPGPQASKDTWFDPPALYFDKGRAVHEATEPGRIGLSASVGCFQTWDQDIADLFERISLNERVVVAN